MGINRAEAQPITPRLASLDRVKLGHPQQQQAELVAAPGASGRVAYEQARNKVGKLKLRAMYKAENWPAWVDQADGEALCPIVGKPEDIRVVVTGGPGKHSAFIPTFGTSKSVTRKIETLAMKGRG